MAEAESPDQAVNIDRDSRLEALGAAMSLAEKLSLLSGVDMWRLPAVERLGIPALVMSDGPAGVRGSSFHSGRSVSFPCETALGASWDPNLVEEVGVALGREARAMGVHVLLAPTVNLHRHPLAGRNFECFSEDPHLTARMALAYIGGVQSCRVACCIKHLVCNDSEFERYTISSEVDEATLRELYLHPFEQALGAEVCAIMTSYNKLNGTYTSEHSWLLDGLLRDEWGFDGVVVSDWFATRTTVEALEAGLDVEMPGPSRMRDAKLTEAVEEGRIDESVVDRSLIRVLRLIDRTAGLAEHDRLEGDPPDSDAVRSLVRRAGARSMVLLKNEGGILPLVPDRLRTVALIGPGADIGMFQGGGSAQVNPGHVAGILPALKEAVGETVDVAFERGCVVSEWPYPLTAPMVTTPSGEPGVEVRYHLAREPDGDPVSVETSRHLHLVFFGAAIDGYSNDELLVRARAVLHPSDTGTYTFTMSGTGTVRLSVDARLSTEGSSQAPVGMVFGLNEHATRVPVEMQAGEARHLEVEFMPHRGDMSHIEVGFVPPDNPDRLERAVDLARRSDLALVVAETPHGWESEGHDRSTMTLPGGQDELIEAVGSANPNTVVVLNAGAPVAMPWVSRVAAVLAMWLPGQEVGNSLADVLTGVVNPSGRLPTTFPAREQDVASAPHYPGSDGRVVYGERFNFGYRFEPGSEPPKPLFPFGHGLSYTRFDLGPPELETTGTGEDTVHQVLVPVTHTGGPAGRHVVQVYVSPGTGDGPTLQLQGFAGVELEPGQTETVVLPIPCRRLRRWADGEWAIPAAALKAYVGSSSAELQYQLDLPAPVEGLIAGSDQSGRGRPVSSPLRVRMPAEVFESTKLNACKRTGQEQPT